MKNTLGLGLDDSVKILNGLGHDISHFGPSLAKTFNVSKAKVAVTAIGQGLCTTEHAMVAGLQKPVATLDKIGNGAVGLANRLGKVGHAAISDLEQKVTSTTTTIETGAKDLGHEVVTGTKDAGRSIEETGKKIGSGLSDLGGTIKSGLSGAGNTIESGAQKAGSTLESGGKKVLHAVEHPKCVLM